MIYHKIPSPFKRDKVTRKLTREFISTEIENLSSNAWVFTDKVDWMNVRIYWDWYNLEFKWRTDNAELPKNLLAVLDNLFMEELFEQKFWETPVILYWEWFWGKIQNGKYNTKEDFILFDVKIWNTFLERENLEDISKSLNIKLVPVELEWTIQEAINYLWAKNLVEWLVWIPKWWYLDKKGNRIIVKIKNKDFLR